MTTLTKKKTKSNKGFHVVAERYMGKLQHYNIYYNNNKVLSNATGIKLKRHEAYAIVKLLNAEKKTFRKWADKFGDPY